MTIHGLDISVYQEDQDQLIKWEELAKDPLQFRFIWCKCSEGELMPASKGAYPVKVFRRQMDGAAKIGLKRGPYQFHYYHVYLGNGNYYKLSPAAQAEAFFAAAEGYHGEIPPMVDLEDPNIYNPINFLDYHDTATANSALAFARTLNAALRQYCEEVARLFGRKPVIYTGAWWWDPWARLVNTYSPVELNWCETYEFYVADYAHKKPTVPTRALRVVAWQYTSTPKTTVLGLFHGESLDCAQWMLGEEEFETWGGAAPQPPVEKETASLEARLAKLEAWAATQGYQI